MCNCQNNGTEQVNEVVTPLKVTGSILSHLTGYYHRWFPWFPSVPPNENWADIIPFMLMLFFVARCVSSAIETPFLNVIIHNNQHK
jgi:hypothetical protein